MPLTDEDFRNPKFIRIKPTYPFSENPKDKFLKFEDYPRSYRNIDGTAGFKLPGYNTVTKPITQPKIDVNVEGLALPPGT